MPVDVVTGTPVATAERARLKLASGIEIAYRVDRTGAANAATRPWLVFAHALACDLAQWEVQVARFALAFNILRFDLRGHGESSAPRTGYALDALADDLRALLDALQVRQCHLVGSSLGGVVGQIAALRFPLRIASLTLVGTTSRANADFKRHLQQATAQATGRAGVGALEQSLLALAFTSLFRTRHVDAVTGIGRAIRSTPVDGYLGCARALAEVDLTARLPSIGCPVLVVGGAVDRYMPAILGEEIARAIPGARFKVLPNAANLLNIEQAEAFNALLAEFLIGLAR